MGLISAIVRLCFDSLAVVVRFTMFVFRIAMCRGLWFATLFITCGNDVLGYDLI